MAGYDELPFVSLALGLVGAAAVITVSALMAKSDLFQPLRYCGRNSIVIYLAFFLPMAATRTLLLKTGWIADIGTMSRLVTAAGVHRRACCCSGRCGNPGEVPVRAAGALLAGAEAAAQALQPALQPAE